MKKIIAISISFFLLNASAFASDLNGAGVSVSNLSVTSFTATQGNSDTKPSDAEVLFNGIEGTG